MFNAIPMIQNSISATSDAMNILSANAQAFQTDGYKQSTYTFASIFGKRLNTLGARYNRFGGAHSQNISQGITLVPMGYDMSQGGLKTGGALDAAVNGQGFFMLQSETSSKFLLSRASDFIFGVDGTLRDIFGRKIKCYKMVNGKADTSQLVDLKLPEGSDLSDVGFEEGGVLMSNYQARKAARDSGDIENLEDGTPLFQLALGRVSNPSQLEQGQGNAFTETINSGKITLGHSDKEAFGSVVGGSSESSNVNPAETTITGIQLQRGYNAIQGALTMCNKFLTQLMEVASKA
jgi:flagellar hook protein FlgE